MDSLSQAETDVASLRPGATQKWFDSLARLALFIVVLVVLLQRVGGSQGEAAYAVVLCGGALLGYLLLTKAEVARLAHEVSRQQPLLTGLLPAALLVPALVLLAAQPEVDTAEVLFFVTLLVLPSSAVVLSTGELRRADIGLGWIVATLPVLAPLARSASAGDAFWDLSALQWLTRLVALLLPLLIALFAPGKQRRQVDFLRLCGFLAIWYGIEFEAFPPIAIADGLERGYFGFAALLLLAYTFAIGGGWQRAPIAFSPTARGLSLFGVNLGLAAALVVPLGLATRQVSLQITDIPWFDALAQGVDMLLFVALPREMILRGILLAYLADNLRLPNAIAVGVTSALMGLMQASQSPDVLWSAALGVIVSVFCARAFLSTRNLATTIALHTVLVWVAWLLFGA